MTVQIDIDQKAVIDAAATKVAEAVLGTDIDVAITNRIEAEISSLFTDEVQAAAREKIDAVLDDALRSILDTKFHPLDMWGNRTSAEPTTIRDQLQQRALKFWEVNVEARDGVIRETSYGGEPRYKAVYKQVQKEAFEDAIKASTDEIVVGFKAALKADASALVAKHIENLIPTRRR